MIIAVSRDTKKVLRVFISSVVLIIAFLSYYVYMSNKYEMEEILRKKEQLLKDKDLLKAQRVEQIIYKEIEKIVLLLEQKNVLKVKVAKQNILIVCDKDTDLDALMVRYGAMALVKKDFDDTKIAIDLKYIIESRLNE